MGNSGSSDQKPQEKEEEREEFEVTISPTLVSRLAERADEEFHQRKRREFETFFPIHIQEKPPSPPPMLLPIEETLPTTTPPPPNQHIVQTPIIIDTDKLRADLEQARETKKAEYEAAHLVQFKEENDAIAELREKITATHETFPTYRRSNSCTTESQNVVNCFKSGDDILKCQRPVDLFLECARNKTS